MSSDEVADRISYYMDELVDSFEDFVKKSLVLITLALATVVIMAMYVMKQIAQQNRNRRTAVRDNRYGRSNSSIDSGYSNTNQTRTGNVECRNSQCSGHMSQNQPKTSASRRSSEKVIREIGFANYPEPLTTSRSTVQVNKKESSSSRTVVPSQVIPGSLSKNQLSKSQHCPKHLEMARTSCCSLCCEDEDKR